VNNHLKKNNKDSIACLIAIVPFIGTAIALTPAVATSTDASSSMSSPGLDMEGAPFAILDNSSIPQQNSNSNITISKSAIPTTPTTSSNAGSKTLEGEIASIQRDDKGRPTWITGGHWWLKVDGPLGLITGNNNNNNISASTATSVLQQRQQQPPHITNFYAMLHMVLNANGTQYHTHKISNFTQTSVIHQDENSATVNGTFDITLTPDETVKNVSGYIQITDNKIEFWIDPVATHNHFGPTTITALVFVIMTSTFKLFSCYQ